MSTPQVYLDFELKIEDLGGGRYRATVVEMPLGEGEAQVSNEFVLPFADDDLSRILAVLGGQARATDAERERTARAFGEGLFGALFAGPIYTVYFSSRDRASQAAGLRVKLSLDDAGALATLPWEFLRDPDVDYLALSGRTPLVRYPRRLIMRPKPAFALPVRVLVMISSPRDLAPIDEQAEWQNLLAATENLRSRGLIELTQLEDASLRTLQRALRGGEYHVFHYIGHSTFDPETGQGMIALEDPYGEGSSFPVRGEDLARELSEENAIRLVVLNSCQSVGEPGDDPFAGISSSIVQRGIPAVIAMQQVISEGAARAFSEELYRAVAEGLPVDAAMAEARRAISHAVGAVEWATPVLTMRASDGVLFNITAERPAARPLWRRREVVWSAGGLVLLVALILGALLLRGGESLSTPKVSGDLDLVIDEIEVFPPHPKPGEKVAIIVHVTNNSEKPVGPFRYDFRQDVLDGAASFDEESPGLGPGDSTTLFIPHVFNWWGAFVSEVRIDVKSVVSETNEFNNIARYPVVTDNANFEVTFEYMPDATPITQSMPLDADSFAAWGFSLEAIPPADDAACAGVVPWIVVDGGDRYVGTGLPESPDDCTGGSIAVLIERSAVSGVVITVDAVRSSDYHIAAFDRFDAELDSFDDHVDSGAGELEISGGFPTRLEVTRAVVEPVSGGPLRITGLQLAEPARLSLALR